MSEISRIEELLTLASKLPAEEEAALAQKPDSVFRRMLVETAKGQVEEMTTQLIAAKEKHDKKLDSIRFLKMLAESDFASSIDWDCR